MSQKIITEEPKNAAHPSARPTQKPLPSSMRSAKQRPGAAHWLISLCREQNCRIFAASWEAHARQKALITTRAEQK
jgi:hypothetical protein